MVLLFLKYKFPEVLPLWARDSAVPCGGWHVVMELAMSSPGQSQPPVTDPQAAPKTWVPTACSVSQDWFCPVAVVSDLASFLLLFPWFLMHVLGICPIKGSDSALHTMSISSCATGGDSGFWLHHHSDRSLVLHMNLPEYSRLYFILHFVS